MKSLIVANWKCNPASLQEAKKLFNSVKKGVKNIKNVEVVICPPFPFILNLKSKIHAPYPPHQNLVGGGAGLNLKLGAQDCFWLEKGAFTGEVSPLMLKDIGCQYVIIGHSERRQYFGETDEIVNKKIKAVLLAKLTPILCLGETKEEREKGRTMAILRKQLASGLKNVPCSMFHIPCLIIAYEPVWAIGTKRACQPATVKEVYLFLRKELKKLFGQRVGERMAILYGGSVTAKNATSYIQEANMQGLLIGSASLKPKEFIQLIRGRTSDKFLEI